jgi:hypothetical protein
MRAQQLTQGKTDEYGLPTPATQTAMQYASWAVLFQVLMVVGLPLVTGEWNVPVDEEGNVDLNALGAKVSKTMLSVLSFIRYAVLIAMYGSTVYVVYGIHTMIAPVEVYPGGTPPVSPAVGATINLTSQFFVIYALGAILKTMAQFGYAGETHSKLTAGTAMATLTVNMAPMLSILFIGARMRALQIDPLNGAPQSWAQTCFWLCTYGIMVQALLCIILPFTGGKPVKGDFEGDIKFEGLSGGAATAITVIRYACLLGVYVGFTVVVYSVFVIKNEANPALTPPLSPAMSCVMNLVFQYFGIYLVLFIAQTLRSYEVSPDSMGKLCSMMVDASKTVMFAPMLSVQFVAARMRSLQLSRSADGSIPQNAGPPVWVQDCMFLSTWSVFIQVLMVLILGAMYTCEMDDDGNVVPPKNVSPAVGYTLNFLRYFSMIAMYGGSCVICYGMVTMTPESVQPYSYENLVPGVKIPAPVTPDQIGSAVPAVGFF